MVPTFRGNLHPLSYPWLWWTKSRTSAVVVIIKYYPPVTWRTCCVYSLTLMSWYLSSVSKNISLSSLLFQIGVSGSSEDLSLLKRQSLAGMSVWTISAYFSNSATASWGDKRSPGQEDGSKKTEGWHKLFLWKNSKAAFSNRVSPLNSTEYRICLSVNFFSFSKKVLYPVPFYMHRREINLPHVRIP